MDIRYFSQINKQYQRMADPTALSLRNQSYRKHTRPTLDVRNGSETPVKASAEIFREVLKQSLRDLEAPSIHKVSQQGDLMYLGQEGPAVQQVKSLLRNNGYPVNDSAYYDRDTAHYVGKFQIKHGLTSTDSPYWGKVGPSTLEKLEEQATWGDYNAELGQDLANYAAAHRSGGRSRCYYYVAKAIHAKTEPFLQGYHAYMAADHLAGSKYFKEVHIEAEKLDELPAGAVVVWGKGNSRSGHISIADGKGYEISDHRSRQMKSHYGGASHRVFIPVAS